MLRSEEVTGSVVAVLFVLCSREKCGVCALRGLFGISFGSPWEACVLCGGETDGPENWKESGAFRGGGVIAVRGIPIDPNCCSWGFYFASNSSCSSSSNHFLGQLLDLESWIPKVDSGLTLKGAGANCICGHHLLDYLNILSDSQFFFLLADAS